MRWMGCPGPAAIVGVNWQLVQPATTRAQRSYTVHQLRLWTHPGAKVTPGMHRGETNGHPDN
jgi:hypothetical protein